MKRFNKFLVFVFVFIFAVVGNIPATVAKTKAESCIEGIIAHNLKKTSSSSVQEWIDGYLTENAGSGTEWYAIALSNYGAYDFTSYKTALERYLSATEIGSASSRLKFALALIATGERNSPFIMDFLENSVGEQGIMSFIFGLHILNNSYECEKYSVKFLTDELLSLQSADGGWSLTGKNGDVDVTAMTVQALAPQYRNNADVRTAIDKALSFLSSRQNEDGTFSSYGVSNPESIAQVIIALSALGIDAEKDTRFIKNSKNLFDVLDIFRTEDGGYCHRAGEESDSTATVQVLCAAVAFKKMKNVGAPFYIFSKENNVTAEKPEVENTEVDKTEPTETTTHENTQTVQQTKNTENISAQTQTATTTAKDENDQADVSYKIWIIAAIIIVSVCLCAVLLAKKRKKLYCVIVLAVAACTILLVAFTNVKPVENNGKITDEKDIIGTVTISIRCDTVKDKNNSAVPENGVVLEKTELPIDADDTVYDVLSQVCREKDIHFEITGTKETLYVEGISNLYEKDYGDLSGWMYFVNGKSPSVGCGKYKLSDKDEIVWCYTCELGDDLSY